MQRSDGAGDAVDSARPGFHLTCTFRGHGNEVHGVVSNARVRQFASLDEKSIKVWKPSGNNGGVELLVDVPFPGFQGNYVTCLVYVDKLKVYIASCLEGSLHVYTDAMNMMVELELPKEARGVVTDMVYDDQTDELITAGASGVRVWYTVANFTLWVEEHKAHPKAPRFRGETGPWVMGKYQDVMERMTLRVPGTVVQSTNVSSSGVQKYKSGQWVSKLVLHDSSQVLFCIMGVSIYGFSMEDGIRCFEWEGIHSQPITGMIYMPERSQAITSSLEPSTVVWRVVAATGQLQQLRAFGSHAAGVTSICISPLNLMTGALDGTVVLWSLQSLEPMFQAKMPTAVKKLEFFGENDFMFVMGKEVRVMWLQWIQTVFAEYDSPVKSLEYLGMNMVLASFEDTSVRIIDSKSAETLIVVAPQLSVSSHTAVLLSSWRSELFVLLSNGQIHCWSLQMGKIPQLKRVLNAEMRHTVLCFALLEGSLLNPQAGMEMGLDVHSGTGRVNDYLVVGTSEGDVQFLDLDRKGELTCRFPVTKVSGVHHIQIDPLRARLVTSSEQKVTIWSLMRLSTCLKEVKLSESPTIIKIALGQVYAASKSGQVQCISMLDGSLSKLPTGGDHSGHVTGLEPNLLLDHFVTCGVDGKVKVFDWFKKLKVSLTLACKLAGVCWLTDAGDILAASGSRLLKISEERCLDTLKRQGGDHLYDKRRIRAACRTDIYSMRGCALLDPLLLGQITPPRTPVGLCTQSSSSRPTSAEEMTASIRAGMLRRQAAQQSRAGTPKGTPKYMLQGADFSRMQGWRPVVNHMDMRLLVGQPRPPPPPDLPPPRVHEGLPGMNNFKAVPPSSPAGLLKYVSPVEFREGSPFEMWRKGSRLPNDQRLAADQKNYATLETTETGEYIVIKPWDPQPGMSGKQPSPLGMQQTDDSASETLQLSRGSAATGKSRGIQNPSSVQLPPIVKTEPRSSSRMMLNNGPGTRSVVQFDRDNVTAGRQQTFASSKAHGMLDASNIRLDAAMSDRDFATEPASGDTESDADASGDDAQSDTPSIDDSSSEDSDYVPEGLEGRMATAFKLVCKHYELSEEIVEKLLLEETMLREMAEHGTVLSADAGGRHTRRKARRKHGKKNTPEQNAAGSEGIKQASKKKKKKRRRRKKHERMLLGQEGIDALRGRSQSDGIIIGCHEYNACEVKTLAANKSFLPKVESYAKNHSKAPSGFRSRIQFPGCQRPTHTHDPE